MLTILLFISAFLIESIGTFVSVIGLSSLFSSNPIIIALAVALDIGKLVSVSFLYKHWRKINFLMKIYMTAAAIVLMLITSAGAFAFLSGEFQKAISNTNQQGVILTALTEEQSRLQKRKEEIDRQIAQLPENMVRGRTMLMNQFGPEVKRLNDRLAEIDKQLPQLKVDTIKKNVEVGPVMYIAEAFDTTPEKAAKWVIFIIIFVFDPLAIALLIAGNFLLIQRENEARMKKDELQAAPPTEDKKPAEQDLIQNVDETLSISEPEKQAEAAIESPSTVKEEITTEQQIETKPENILFPSIEEVDNILPTENAKAEKPELPIVREIEQVIEPIKKEELQTVTEEVKAQPSSLEKISYKNIDVDFYNDEPQPKTLHALVGFYSDKSEDDSVNKK